MNGKDVLVETRDLTKRYGPHIVAVDHVSLTLRRGEGSDTPGVNSVVDGTQATLVLVAYVLVFALIASIELHRRDVT